MSCRESGAAAAWWELCAASPGRVHLSVPTGRRPRDGLLLHGTRHLAPADVCVHKGVPVTSPARTLLDLAETMTPRELEQAASVARVKRLVTPKELAETAQRARGRKGLAKLNALQRAIADPAMSRSQAEERLLALIRDAGLPQPELNVRVDRYEVDFVWRAQRLVVEVDGYAYHASREAFERDRARDRRLHELGYRVLRITWWQIVEEPLKVIAAVAARVAIGFPP